MNQKLLTFIFLSALFIGCDFQDDAIIIKHVKMAEWPEVYFKEVAEWYIANPIWTVEDLNSVNVYGKILFRNDSASLTMKARLNEGDTLWTISMELNGKAADSSETADLYDEMAKAAAKGITRNSYESMIHPTRIEDMSQAAKNDLAYANLVCKKSAMEPSEFKQLNSLNQMVLILPQIECILNNAKNEELIRTYSIVEKNIRISWIWTHNSPKMHDYINKALSTDTLWQNLMRNKGMPTKYQL